MKSISSLALLCLLCAFTTSAIAQSPEIDSSDELDSVAEPLLWQDRETGYWFSADALLWKRSGTGSGGTVIGGPEGFGFSGGAFSNEGGYRLGAGWLIDSNYELQGSWTSFSG
ncbi:MAG: hypothetical protein FJ267_13955 [Planctomycetes bacterium]|nr:hypothetical protein [Planctomycetota bacterium]